MNDYKYIIPKLKKDVSLESIESDNLYKAYYILNTPTKKYKISELYYRTIILINGKRTYEKIAEELNLVITAKEIQTIYENEFKNIGIVENSILLSIIVVYSSIFIHELGHFFCCKYFKGNPGSIGIGIYFMAPVLFTNLDDIWRLRKRERILINLAGIYLQNIYLFFISLLAIIFDNRDLFMFSLLFGIASLANLVPFIKLDGYWILADYLEIPNLLSYVCNYLIYKLRIKKVIVLLKKKF